MSLVVAKIWKELPVETKKAYKTEAAKLNELRSHHNLSKIKTPDAAIGMTTAHLEIIYRNLYSR